MSSMKSIPIHHLSEVQAEELRLILSKPGAFDNKANHDVLDLAGESRSGVHHLHYVHYNVPQLQHLIDGLVEELDALTTGMNLDQQEGRSGRRR